MKIIIIGCGKVGSALAEELTMENHEVAIVDISAQKLQEVGEDLDALQDQTIRENMFLLLPIRNRWKTEENWKARTHLLSLVLLLQKTLVWICRKEQSDIPFWKN